MKIYHVSQNIIDDYDTYSDFVCVAGSEEEAKNMTPSGDELKEKTEKYDSWPGKDNIDNIQVVEIGIAKKEQKRGVICYSFHAG